MRLGLFAAVAVAAILQGCSTGRVASQEPPLEEIPVYARGAMYDTRARVCVYTSLRYSHQLFEALRKAGYDMVEPTAFADRRPKAPDFILEPMTFQNWTRVSRGETWLFTRIVVMLRGPGRLAPDGQISYGAPGVREFQAYARTKLTGRRTKALLRDYVANEAVAVDNLLCVPEFRKALEKRD